MRAIGASRSRGVRSFGVALRMLASLAPVMSQDAMTSHKAIWWRSANARRDCSESPVTSDGSAGSANNACITGQKRFCGCI